MNATVISLLDVLAPLFCGSPGSSCYQGSCVPDSFIVACIQRGGCEECVIGFGMFGD